MNTYLSLSSCDKALHTTKFRRLVTDTKDGLSKPKLIGILKLNRLGKDLTKHRCQRSSAVQIYKSLGI